MLILIFKPNWNQKGIFVNLKEILEYYYIYLNLFYYYIYLTPSSSKMEKFLKQILHE